MFKNLKIGSKLAFGFFSVLLLMAMLGGFALMGLRDINNQTLDLSTNWLPSVRVVEEMNTNTSDYRILEYRHILSETDQDMNKVEKLMDELMALLKKNRAEYEKLISSPEEQKIYDEFSRQYQAYLDVHNKIQPLSRQMKTKEAMDLMLGDSKRLFDSSSDLLLKLVDINVKGGEASAKFAEAV